VLSLTPLVVRAGNGSVELLDVEPIVPLAVGDRLELP
jgi:hypothetical protein